MSVIDIDKLLHDMHMEAFDMEFMEKNGYEKDYYNRPCRARYPGRLRTG